MTIALYDKHTKVKAAVFAVVGKQLVSTPLFKELDESVHHALTKWSTSDANKAKTGKIIEFSTLYLHDIERVVFLTFKDENCSRQSIREALGKLYKKLKQEQLTDVVIDFASFELLSTSKYELAHLIGEMSTLATYDVHTYKTLHTKKLDVHTYLNTDDQTIFPYAQGGVCYGEGSNLARTLVNMPPNFLTAMTLADEAKSLATQYHFQCKVYEKEALVQMGAGALLAVNQGSTNPPALIVLTHQGGKEDEPYVALVGKGITYDTGGYSLKPRDGMVNMKSDMGGAASVLGAMKIIGDMKPNKNIMAVIPATDNMVSGDAYKPDDVITSLSGKTIEVLNTDAEGRLALADGITYAIQHGAKCVVDIATLTGGIVVALGTETTGAMTNDDELYEYFKGVTKVTGEDVWQLPIFERDMKRVANSKMADLNNSPGRDGHAIMAGAFLAHFAKEVSWLHLDIAGTATTKTATDFGPAGATGVMARSLAQFACTYKG